MYAVLVDRARSRQTWKRGRGFIKISLDHIDPASFPMPEFADLREALESLGAVNPRLRQVLELRFLIGLSALSKNSINSKQSGFVGERDFGTLNGCATAT